MPTLGASEGTPLDGGTPLRGGGCTLLGGGKLRGGGKLLVGGNPPESCMQLRGKLGGGKLLGAICGVKPLVSHPTPAKTARPPSSVGTAEARRGKLRGGGCMPIRGGRRAPRRRSQGGGVCRPIRGGGFVIL